MAQQLSADRDKPEIESRRGFLTKAAAVAAGGVCVGVPVIAGIGVVVDPLNRTHGGEAKPIRVTALSAVPDDGVPRAFPVIADRQDAWNLFPQEKVGTVYLRRQAGVEKVQALSATCPHLGCYVPYNAQQKQFQCPCHTSKFDVEGERIMPCVSPRRLDELEVVIEGDAVLVRFQEFVSGIEEKHPR